MSEEMELLHDGLSINYIVSDPTISECPVCKTLCKRKDNTINWVYCLICSQLGKPVGTAVGLGIIVAVSCNVEMQAVALPHF